MFHSLSHLGISPGTGVVKSLPWDLKILLFRFFFNSRVALQRFAQGADRSGAALFGWGYNVCDCCEAFPLLITLNKWDQG